MPETSETTYEIWQDDMCVAMADSLNDAHHYALVYSEDGPVDLYEVKSERTKIENWRR